jgi:hypothetical protein
MASQVSGEVRKGRAEGSFFTWRERVFLLLFQGPALRG